MLRVGDVPVTNISDFRRVSHEILPPTAPPTLSQISFSSFSCWDVIMLCSMIWKFCMKFMNVSLIITNYFNTFMGYSPYWIANSHSASQ